MLATTLSLVIIFVPIAFMTGYARRYVNQFGWTMAFSILVSMLVSFTLTPMLSSRLLQAAARGPAAATPSQGMALLRAGSIAHYGRILALVARPPRGRDGRRASGPSC